MLVGLIKKLSPKFPSFHQHSEEEMTTPSVTLRFIRNADSSKTDDILRIVPSPSSVNPELNTFVVKFSFAKSFAPVAYENQVSWNHEQVYEYVSSLLMLLTLDNDPFKSVQIDLPLAPSLLFEVSTLSSRIPHILRILYTTLMNSWPTYTMPLVAAAPIEPSTPVTYSYTTPVRNETMPLESSTPVTYSYTTPVRNETVQEEDDDMPPLIPVNNIYPCGSCPARCNPSGRSSHYRRHPRHTFYNNDGAEYKKHY